MNALASLATLSPVVLVHLGCALGALVLGPAALWARKGSPMHRGSGYTWVALMAGAALSSLFIRDFRLPNLAGYTPIHLLTLLTVASVGGGLWYVTRHDVARHRRCMRGAYLGGCLGAGLFALMPGRFLGQLLWPALRAAI